MKQFTVTLEIQTQRKRELVDLTDRVRAEVRKSGIREGVCAAYAQGATAALMVQENADPELPEDVLDCLDRLIPAGQWRHDRIDDNGAAHLQAGLVGPSEVIPVRAGDLALSRWQNLFLCDFDGPRQKRFVLLTITGS